MCPRRRLPTLLSGLALLAGLSGCGVTTGGSGAEGSQRTAADTEGTYLVFPHDLTYQIQISRYLNPADPEDRSYVQGLRAGSPPLAPDEQWFVVFIRVSNETKQPHLAAADFRMVDAQGTSYQPVPLDGGLNSFAYQASTLAPNDVVPPPASAAAENTIQGSELLFRIRRDFFFNRPVVFRITSPVNPQLTREADIDV